MDISPEMMLRAYACGYFPMAPDQDCDELEWFDPQLRGVLPLDGFHLSRRLRRTALSGTFDIRTDSAFEAVMRACATSAPGRETSWINEKIIGLFCELHEQGHAHSVESWEDGELVGGLYGVALGGAFFGESMFSTRRDASKVALVHLVARLRLGGYCLLDTQFTTTHLESFGCIEVPRAQYKADLARAIAKKSSWDKELAPAEISREIAAMAAASR